MLATWNRAKVESLVLALCATLWRIGETCDIGHHVKLYQGVTLGALSFPMDADGNLIRNMKRHPTIEDRVVIYASATILGGKTVILCDPMLATGSSGFNNQCIAFLSSSLFGAFRLTLHS